MTGNVLVITAVPTINNMPPGLRFMIVRKRIALRTLIIKLNQCAAARNDCLGCGFLGKCEGLYRRLLDEDQITNFQGSSRNVTRYY